MKKFILVAVLFLASVGAFAQCAGISFSTTANANAVTFIPALPANYTINGYTWNFGDGGTSNLASPTHTYASNGLYNACLMVYGVNNTTNTGFQCYICDSIYVTGAVTPCAANYTFTQNGLTVNFSGTGTGPAPITNWAWNFGDGNQSNLQNPSHTYATAGTYYPCLSIYGYVNNVPFTCNICDTIVVTNNVTPCNANFTSVLGGGSAVIFTNTSTAPGIIAGYNWTFGDGGSSAASNPIYTYAASGWYNVCLTIWGSGPNGAFQCTYCDSVFAGGVVTPCNTNYTFTQSGLTVNFTGTGSGPGPISSWTWDFGDNTQSNLQNPTHTYTTAGTYYPCLTISGIYNNTPFTCTYCDTVVVTNAGLPCSPSFTTTIGGGNLVYFINTSTAPGTIAGYSWTFGDGGTSSLQNPTHTYASSGWYNVCLTIWGSGPNGAFQCNFCDSVYTGAAPNPCNSSFTFTANGLSVNFTGSGSGPGPITNWAWNFGDGNQSSVQNPTHTYATAGTYYPCLTIYGVYNNTPYTCMYCDTIVVTNGGSPCNASFTFTYGANGAVTFVNTSTGTGTLYSSNWTFGDGGTANTTNATHTYTNTGWYNVCLTVIYNLNGQLTTCIYCDSVPVQTTTTACAMTANFTNFVSGPYVVFTNTSTCNGCNNTMYTWNFGDGGTSNLNSPTYTYIASGTYTACLIAVGYNANQQICSDTFCTSVTVNLSNINDWNLQHNTLSVVPNPAHNRVTVMMPSKEAYQVKVVDITGAVIMESSVMGATEYNMTIEPLAQGMYFIRVSGNKQQYNGRFIKQ